MDVGEAEFAEEGGGVEGADAVVAVDDDGAGFPGGEFGGAGGELVEGDEGGGGEVGGVPLVLAADVEEEEVVVAGEGFVDLRGVDFPGGVDGEGGGFAGGHEGTP